MRRSILLLTGAALLASCSRPDAGGDEAAEMSTADVAEAPAVAPAVAPGVAFSYHYAFVLPDERIAAVQERHAAACEKLGIARCRVTGMSYELIEEDRVRGQLRFKLAPDLARRFGTEGIAAVVEADGKLVRSTIQGDDAGAAISESQIRSAELRSQLARLEQRLAARGLGDDERAELQRQAEAIRAQLSAERNARAFDEERLANTPMTFDYAGDEGFRFGNAPFGNALDTAWSSFTWMVSLLLLVIGAALPWLVLAALLLFAWRSRPVRWLRRVLAGRSSTATANPTEP